MTRKYEAVAGAFTAFGRAADDTLEIASAIRAGRLTRHQFEDWLQRRREQGEGLVITLREKTANMAKPLELALERGEELLRSVAPRPVARRRHARRRTAVHRAAVHRKSTVK
jgi:hypothetical protein